jgi:Peptidase A4 family
MTATSPQTPSAESALDRTHGFPLPSPPCNDPSQWDPYELMYHGLPLRPVDPGLLCAWNKVFGRRLCFLKYSGKEMDQSRLPPDADLPTTTAGPLVFSGGHFGTSPNWSGASLDATSGRTFRQIYGQWTVPDISPPADGRDTEYQCATWIGLDGQRRYKSSTLPQLGTLQKLSVNRDGVQLVVVQAWTQWWVANDADTKPVEILSFPVKSGDCIAAVLTVLGEHAVLCNLINQSRSPPAMVAVHVTAPPLRHVHREKGGYTPRYAMAGATAEWVLERPAVIGDPNQLQGFPAYTETAFTSCLAVEGAVSDTAPIGRSLATARFIRMYEVRAEPKRVAFISMPTRAGETAVRLTYGDSWQ